MTGPELLLACALHVAPQTMQAVIQVESHGHELALHVNGADLDRQPATLDEAIATARSAMAQGYSIDLGLMQINSRNLDRLGYSLEQIFDPCVNLRAGSAILSTDYAAAVRVYGEGQTALRAALSAYNSGDFERGFRNGYVARYYAPPHAPRTHPAGALHRKAVTANPNLAGMAIFTRKETDDDLNKMPTRSDPQLSLDLRDFMDPGIVVEVDPDEASALGAFEETALDEAAAWEANLDAGETADV